MTKFRRRTRLLILTKFQIRYISLILVFMFSTALITGYTVYVTTWMMFGEKLAAVYPQGLLLDIVKKINMVLLLRLIFLTPLVVLIGLVLSNKIAGPMYNIKRFLRKVASGNYETRLRLRRNDELQDLGRELNCLLSKLRSERDLRRQELSTVKDQIDEIETIVTVNAGDTERLLSSIRKLRKEAGEIKG